MRTKDFLMTVVFLLALILSAFGQGLAINIVMKSARKTLDERFVEGRFFWKPELPLLFKPARAGIVHFRQGKRNFIPPFAKHKRSG